MKKRKNNTSLNRNSSIQKFFVFLISFIITEVIGIIFLLYGPLPKFRNWIVTATMSNKKYQYIAIALYQEQTIQEILKENKVNEQN